MHSSTRKPLPYNYTRENLPSNENDFNSGIKSEVHSHPKLKTPKTEFNFSDSFIAQQMRMRKEEIVQSESSRRNSIAKPFIARSKVDKISQSAKERLKDLELRTRLKLGIKSAQNLFSNINMSKIAGTAMMVGLAFGNVGFKENIAYAANPDNQTPKTESVKVLDIDTNGNISLTEIANQINQNTKITGSNKQIQKFYDQGVFTRTGDRTGGTVTVNLDMLKKVLGKNSKSNSKPSSKSEPVGTKTGAQTKPNNGTVEQTKKEDKTNPPAKDPKGKAKTDEKVGTKPNNENMNPASEPKPSPEPSIPPTKGAGSKNENPTPEVKPIPPTVPPKSGSTPAPSPNPTKSPITQNPEKPPTPNPIPQSGSETGNTTPPTPTQLPDTRSWFDKVRGVKSPQEISDAEKAEQTKILSKKIEGLKTVWGYRSATNTTESELNKRKELAVKVFDDFVAKYNITPTQVEYLLDTNRNGEIMVQFFQLYLDYEEIRKLTSVNQPVENTGEQVTITQEYILKYLKSNNIN